MGTKLRFTDKMVLDKADIIENRMTLQFTSYLKEDYVERMLKLSINGDVLQSAYFSSNRYGTAMWINGKGVTESHRWEDEDDLQDISYLSRHYPSPLENGFVSDRYAAEKIIPDVLGYMLDHDLSGSLSGIFESDHYSSSFNWHTVMEHNRKISEEFIAGLIKQYEDEILQAGLTEKYGKTEMPAGSSSGQGDTRTGQADKKTGTSSGLLGRLGEIIFNTGSEKNQETSDDSERADQARELMEKARKLSEKINKL